jgi:hypothetical protein
MFVSNMYGTSWLSAGKDFSGQNSPIHGILSYIRGLGLTKPYFYLHLSISLMNTKSAYVLSAHTRSFCKRALYLFLNVYEIFYLRIIIIIIVSVSTWIGAFPHTWLPTLDG